jgi:hypothetical protein
MPNPSMRDARDAAEQGSDNPGVARGTIDRGSPFMQVTRGKSMIPKAPKAAESTLPEEMTPMEVEQGGDQPG